jgi:hypothetical protein
MKPATTSWDKAETDPQRIAILTAADRLLAGKPTRSTGNLSVVQLAVEAGVKYWIVAQKHTDLRDHFQRLAVPARQAAAAFHDEDELARLRRDHAKLKAHSDGLEQLLQTYATVVNELAVQNEALQAQINSNTTTVTPLRSLHGHRVGTNRDL